jgi:putative DNA primase/helicase
MAERMVSEHGARLRHVHGIGWHTWEQNRWREDDERADLAAAVETVKNALRKLERMSGQDRDDLYKDIRKTESASGLEGMAKIASSQRPISVASRLLDADAHLFNTPGGTVDLHAGHVRPADREDLITKVSGGVADGSTDEEWEEFLATILPDEEVRNFVQRLFGYAMLGKVTEHVMPIFTGTGANGKSTIRDAIAEAFGDYAIEVDPAILMESKHERHGAFKMRLRGARLVTVSETEKNRRFAEATMKRLVGGEQIEANYMHKNPIQFDPSHTLIMMTNHLPKVSGDDPAVWRRILVVPFDVVIPVEKRDPELPGRLKDARDAVLSWVYAGWTEYQRIGLCPPEAVKARTAEYQAKNDVLARFLEERTLTSPHGAVKARDLFTAWTSWCHATGEQSCSEVDFAASMAVRGFEKKRGSAGQQYLGLLLVGDQGEDQDEDQDDKKGWPPGARRTPPAPPAEPVQEAFPGAR